MNSILQDIRYALRTLGKHRAFAAVAVVTLALGIGANTAIFSVADAILFRPVLLKNLDRLVLIFGERQGRSNDFDEVSLPDILDFRAASRTLDSISGYTWWTANLTGAGDPERVHGFRVAANFFQTLGADAALGRTFQAAEEEQGRDGVVVLSHGLWERRFGADPNALGRTIQLDGRAFQVIGIMSREFRFPAPAELWAPLATTPAERAARGNLSYLTVARLAPDATVRQANAEIATIARRIAQEHPQTHARRSGTVTLLREHVSGEMTAQYTLLLMGVVAFVLLIACANVANLQFARVSSRAREIAVRSALGAGRWRLIRQLLTESVMLGVLGSGLAVILAVWGVDLIRGGMPAEVEIFLPGWKRMSVNGSALAFTLAIAVLGGIVAGVAPALVGARADLTDSLKEGGRGATAGARHHRLRNVLVVGQITLALVLLVGAGLMVKGFRGVAEPIENLDAAHALALSVALPDSKYAQRPQMAAFETQALENLRAIPRVEAVALVSDIVYSGRSSTSIFTLEGHPPAAPGEMPSARLQSVSAEYFQVMRIPLRRGRVFRDADGEGSQRVAIISDAFARRYFADLDPLGKRVKLGPTSSTAPWLTVIGVVGDIRHDPFEAAPRPLLYRPYSQAPPRAFGFIARVPGDPKQFVSSVRAAIASIDPNQPVFDVHPLNKVITNQLVGIGYVAGLMGVFGLLALVLAAIGIYSVMAYAVVERTHEIGVRLALGAARRDVQWLIMRRGLTLTGVGLVIGLTLAVVLARWLSTLIVGSSNDVGALAGVSLVLIAASLAACWIPAHRATRVDPMISLRCE